MSIRTRLLILVVAIMLPVAVGAILGLSQIYRQQRAAAERNIQELVRVLALVVEHELSQREAILKTLARSPPLLAGDLGTFDSFSRATVPPTERTIVLVDLDGRQLVNTRVPFGSPGLPQNSNALELRSKLGFAPAATFVTDLYFARTGKQHSFAVQVPVMRDEKVIYYLSMGSYTDTLQRLVSDPRLGDGWNAAIFDRQGILLARRMEPERFVGRPGSRETIERFKTSAEGVMESVRLDGSKALTAYSAIGQTGWTYVVSMPEGALRAPLLHAVSITLLVTLFAFFTAIAGALIASRSIAGPFRDLAQRAAYLAKGERKRSNAYNLTEADMIASALAGASEEIKAANRDLENRVENAVKETKHIQEKLLQNQKLEALGRLTGGIAHDFNNLLQTVSTGIEVVLRKSSDELVTKVMQGAKRAVQNGASLTRQLMAFGRVQPASRETIHIPNEMQRMQELIAGALRRDINVGLTFGDALWNVTVDRLQFELAVLNACFNARDAMPDGGELKISAGNASIASDDMKGLAGGRYVVLQITDSGSGISPQIMEKIFDPFFTTKDIGKGSGLGLAQVYGFAAQAGGGAFIESTLGEGTTLSIWLPKATGPVSNVEAQRDVAAELPDQHYRILFVEDDARVRSVVLPALEAAGFEVLFAESALDASEILAQRAGDIDAVFSDIVMPGGRSGIDLANEIDRKYKGKPVVLATGFSEAHASEYMTLMKPYQVSELISILLERIRRAKATPA